MSQGKEKAITIIVPTYNERDNIRPLVERIHRVLSAHDYEILLIDDSSNDGTSELALSLSPRYPVTVIVRKNKRGLASAVVDGLEYARGRIIGVMDADLQHPPEILTDLMKQIQNGADIAIASRYVEGGSCQGWGLTRNVISKGAIFIAHLLLPSTRRIKDPMAGYFMVHRKVVASANLKPNGFKILLEMLIEGEFQKVAEIPYNFQTRSSGQSKLKARQQVDYLKHICSLMKRNGELLRFAKFCGVGLSGVGVNMGLLWLLTEMAGLQYLLSAVIGIETSIITNFLLNDYFTFHDRRSYTAKSTLHRLLKFNLVSIAGLAINLGTLWLFTDVFGVYYLISNIFGIAMATLWNYGVNTYWTWR